MRELYDDLLGAAVFNLLHFDTAFERATGNPLESGRTVDLLITDIGLPGGMNGRQLADAGLAIWPALKILFITGYAENDLVANGDLKPGVHLLSKPFRMDVLAGRIRSIISE
jgi:DNA-binding response OmpR family regulator